MMKKKQSIIALVLAAIVTVLLGWTMIKGWGPTGTGSMKNINLGLDLSGGVSITYQAVKDNPTDEEMSDTRYKLEQRAQQYSEEAQVYLQGDNRITIEIPGATDATTILEEMGKPGSLYFIKQTNDDGTENYTYDSSTGEYVLNGKTIEELEEDGSVVLTGKDVESAEAMHQQNSTTKATESVVQLKMTDEGKQKFADATQEAYSAGKSIGIYYDEKFVSVPSVNAVISDGTAVISGGNMDWDEATSLASTLRIGSLSLKLEEINSSVVGAQLGSAAVSTSVKAGAIGIILIIIFLAVVYRLPGIAAGWALLIYVELNLISLNAFDLTLTLPGIAGVILSIGMAVDANVIIFARIREEIATGKTVKSAIQIGFKKALSAIIDGNVTTLIAAVVLYFMGTGTVKGFAQTLALGIVVSLFTALVVTKLILNAFYAMGIRNEKFYGRAKETKVIDFLGKKKIFFILSAVVIIAGFVTMGVHKGNGGDALNYSLEFKGGTSTSVEFNEDMSIEELDEKVVPIIEEISKDANVQTQKVQGSNQVIFKSATLDVSQREELNSRLEEEFGVDPEKITAETISSTISSEMRTGAVSAVVVSTVLMLLYVWFRFKDVRFGASSVAALVHDVLVVLAFYAAARVSVGNTFIACMLTIVGYSINATIVIFDRIRENMTSYKTKEELAAIVNRSISQTLSRSIFTSLTTFIMVAVLYILGVSSIKEFALPLMVGIACGTYSSICLASAFWYLLRTRVGGKKAEKDKKAAK